MSEKPILFSTEMIRAILDGRKTQTRRVIKPQPPPIAQAMRDIPGENRWWCAVEKVNEFGVSFVNPGMDYQYDWKCPFGMIGDELWVREAWRLGMVAGEDYDFKRQRSHLIDVNDIVRWESHLHYRADEPEQSEACWRPSIYMPRWASRIQLRITDIRVERVCDISHDDAELEGIDCQDYLDAWGNVCQCYKCGDFVEDDAILVFEQLWDAINGKRDGCDWESNPFCWVVEFERVRP